MKVAMDVECQSYSRGLNEKKMQPDDERVDQGIDEPMDVECQSYSRGLNEKKIQPDDERFDQGIDELIYKNSSVTPEDLSFSTNLATNLSMFLHFRDKCEVLISTKIKGKMKAQMPKLVN